ncbi:MAG: hypothetical protein D6814_00290, partial [Calditrichaeota bacterium]
MQPKLKMNRPSNYISHLLSNLRSFEKAALAYVAFTGLLALVMKHHTDHGVRIFLYHLLMIAGILTIPNLLTGKSGLVRVFKDWYIFILFPILFKELTFLSRALFGYYLEPILIASDRQLLTLFGHFSGPFWQSWLVTELMALAYASYYFIVPGVGIYIYRKWPFEEYEFYLFKFCATMFIFYMLFILIPVRGPHHSA